jgi:glucose-1-phosphate thymidylyltransferase
VAIGEGSLLRRCTVRGPAIIGANCHLEDCYIGAFTAIGDGVRLVSCEIEYSIVLEGSCVESVDTRIEGSLLGKNAGGAGRGASPAHSAPDAGRQQPC